MRQRFPSLPPSVASSPVKPILNPVKSGRTKRSAADTNAEDIEAESMPSAKKFKADHLDNSEDGDEIQVLQLNDSAYPQLATTKDQILEDEGLLLVDEQMDF